MKKILIIPFLFFITVNVQPQVEAIVTTEVALNKVENSIRQLVNESLDRFDYSAAKILMEILVIIDAWKDVNSDLLDKAFSGIDEQSRNIFSRLEATASEIISGIDGSIDKINDIAVLANQISENLPTQTKRSYIIDYSPKVIFPTNSDFVLINLTGINLDKASAKYISKEGDHYYFNVTGPTKAFIQIPVSELNFDDSSPNLVELRINHFTRDGRRWLFWPKYSTVERSILINTLPQKFGSFELTGTREYKKRERKIYESNAGKFRGKNTSVVKMARPLSGYKWDLSRGVSGRNDFRIRQYHGEKARCEEIQWNESSENGISIRARCDAIGKIKTKPGYVGCGVKGPIYREVKVEDQIRPIRGSINWGVDKSISIPSDLRSFQLKIISYDGTIKLISNDYSDEQIRVVKDKDKIIIRVSSPSSL